MNKTSKSRSNTAVQGTNDSSIVSKASMVQKGYFADDFSACFIKTKSCSSVFTRSPLINRGYFIRAYAINHVLTSFMNHFNALSLPYQVLSLGSGFDSAYFRLKSAGKLDNCCYVEIDFPDLQQRKLEMIHTNEKLWNLIDDYRRPEENKTLSDDSEEPVVFNSRNYKLVGADMKELQRLTSILESMKIDFGLPTLILSEVVITYLDSSSSSNIIEWSAKSFKDSMFVCYEQINPSDGFGQFMCQHFKKLGSPLRTIDSFPTLKSQLERYSNLGWTESMGCDMNYFYNKLVPASERSRIELLDLFDEFEEWHLKCSHYTLITATKGSCTMLKNVIWGVDGFENCKEGGFLFMNRNGCSHKEGMSNGVAVIDRGIANQGSDAVLENLTSTDVWCQRYGHSCSSVTTNDNQVAVIVGGFGKSEIGGSHQRLKRVDLVVVNNLKMTRSFLVPFEALYHTCSTIDDNRLVIFGGRKSPSSCSNDVSLISLSSDQSRVEPFTFERVDLIWSALETTGEKPCPRWRHSASVLNDHGFASVLIFGGRATHSNALGDCWILNCNDWTWKKIDTVGESPCPRHTHTSDVWDGEVVISCGLDENSNPLNTVHLFNLTTLSWRKLEVKGAPLVPRYSHASVIDKGILFLIGGVTVSQRSPYISLVRLSDGTVQNLDVSIVNPDVETYMLHNHRCLKVEDSHATADKGHQRFLVVGGGGNCFSFGTHFNTKPLSLSISDVFT